VHFVTGYTMGVFTGHARATAFRVAPGYAPLNEGASGGADWAILTLDTSLGANGHILPLLPAPVAIGDRVVLAGYGQDREEVMEADLTCTVSGWTGDGGNRDLMRHGCSGTRGTSGAPVMMQQGGHWVAVGLQIAAVIGRSEGLAVPSFAIGPYLSAQK
jgi:protease YdgD